MLPRVQSAAEVVALDLLLTQVEAKSGLPRGHIGIEAQIETARGLINVEEICAASPRLETIILGPVDFSASMEMPSLSGGLQIPEYPGDYFHYVFMKILMAGRANGLQVIDGPYVRVRDSEGFRDFCRRTPTRSRSSTRCSRRRRSSSTGPTTSSTHTRRRRPKASARAR